ncbi:unnamed protein product [Parajaminaea phylloscopi]
MGSRPQDQPSEPHASQRPWYNDIRRHLSRHPPASTWTAAKEQSLLEPYTYLASRPGKEIRSKLIDAFNYWLQVPEEQLGKVRKVVAMLHNASLLMDDVEDNSDLRRGMPVAHKVYGTPQVLNTANYVYFLVFREIEAMGSTQGPTAGSAAGAHSSPSESKAAQSERLLVEEMINLHRGQGLDLLWRDTLQCPTEEEYVEMVRNKTGGLLRIAGGLMSIWSAAPESSTQPVSGESSSTGVPDLLPLLDLIGLLFQIRDDYMNLDSDAYAQNKGFAEDLTEGKFSFPMIHGIRWSESNPIANASGPSQSPIGEMPASKRSHTAPQPVGSIPRTALDSPIPGQPSSLLLAPLQASTRDRSDEVGSASVESIRGVDRSGPVVPNRQLLSILSSRPTDEHLKRYAISYLRHVSGSFRYCRRVMRRLDKIIWEELERVESAFASAPLGGTNQADTSSRPEGADAGPASAPLTSPTRDGRNEQLRTILLALRQGWWEDQGEEADDGDGSSED